ncbi:hypothetical protein Hdeb2414_s0003g00115281 [Helianthus debilis subsp. tardiflorus]
MYASDASAVYGLSVLGLLLISQTVEKCGGFLLCFLVMAVALAPLMNSNKPAKKSK